MSLRGVLAIAACLLVQPVHAQQAVWSPSNQELAATVATTDTATTAVTTTETATTEMATTDSTTAPQGSPCAAYLPPGARIGINVAREEGKEITDYAVDAIGAGWYLDYTWHLEPARPQGMTYFPMVRRGHTNTETLTTTLGPAVDANPGSTWLIGNEPDNREQDNQTPAAYATFYHTLYHFLKGRDPSSRVAMAPVTAVTPLRLRYLDMVLTSYQERYGTPLPVDLWTVHIYLLPEDQAWGIGIPPGLDEYAAEAVHYTVEEHDDLARFGEQLRRFRGWMAANGYREHELILSEYGILLSPHHGYDDARVRDFLLGSFAYLQQARDPATGLPADDNRLVQRWGWFSLNYYAFDPAHPQGPGLNGNLFDHGRSPLSAGRPTARGLPCVCRTQQRVGLRLSWWRWMPLRPRWHRWSRRREAQM